MRSTTLLLAVLAACKPDMPPAQKLPPLVGGPPPAHAGSGSAAPGGAGDTAPPPVALLGFDPATGPQERARWAALRDAITTDQIDRDVVELAREPHFAGTPGDARVAGVLQKALADAGFAVTTSEYTIYLPTPTKIALSIGGKPLATRERPPKTRGVDGLAAPGPDAPELVTWNAYGAGGSVTAPIVYAGFGFDADLAALAAAKVDVKGKVALLRYGPGYRGAQVAAVEKAGAKAVIFYIDGKDEPNRDPDTVQRGTVAYYWQYTGDPGAKRHERRETLPKIPVVTISATTAATVLAQLKGAAAPDALATPTAKTLGPGPAVTLAVTMEQKPKVIRDVIGKLAGASDADGAVMLGNHFDAWVYGALDPHSGTATLLAIARAMGKLAKDAHWVPARPIEIAFWDAEEPGVIGSTEWVEQQGDALGVFAYFNIDTGCCFHALASLPRLPFAAKTASPCSVPPDPPAAGPVKNRRI